MALPQSKINTLNARHASWLASMPESDARTCLSAIDDLVASIGKLGPQGAGLFFEKVGVSYAAKYDPTARRMLEIAKESGLVLTERGWAEA